MRRKIIGLGAAAAMALGILAAAPSQASTDTGTSAPYVATWLGHRDAELFAQARRACDAADQATADDARAEYEDGAAHLQHLYTMAGDEHHVASIDLALSHMTKTADGTPCDHGTIGDDCCYNRPLLETWYGHLDGRLYLSAMNWCHTADKAREDWAFRYDRRARMLANRYQADGNPQNVPTVEEAGAHFGC